ncbi:hypothetical protein CONPUDRAFT_87845 [Coniophora puteana RWD-64-598 SS2]|uniref:Uncharacterized protein n=1 Tax=Coniophora puteana (strain RWD-64-598) TaxID=741705 RepID=A0A5M3N3B5_CONPW|nr:uncharacterized protein CONPUDRAFT_87845 [Coniophora puteana RWD-64-598 SS2]EIW85391.1 hypothetical protein CONPUDRAFT_87845 [Coniophora puteana RWD-64-598 SS2]
MSKRLSSFKGPSTPNSSPARQVNQPESPSRLAESTYHRKIRASLQELRLAAHTWDDIVLIDGLKAAKTLVDSRTELDNALAQIPTDSQPRTRLVEPKLATMDKCIEQLDAVLVKLRRQFRRMSAVIDAMESILFEAHATKGPQWCKEQPLWISWSLEKFVTSVSDILLPYHRSLNMHIEIVESLRPHSATFEVSKDAIRKWVDQPFLEDESWDAIWEDLCAVEVHRWDTA